MIILYIGVFLKYGFSDLPKYIDKRDCAQQEELLGGLVKMIHWGREWINTRNLKDMVSRRLWIRRELYDKLLPLYE